MKIEFACFRRIAAPVERRHGSGLAYAGAARHETSISDCDPLLRHCAARWNWIGWGFLDIQCSHREAVCDNGMDVLSVPRHSWQ
jgi:hypothetical protein